MTRSRLQHWLQKLLDTPAHRGRELSDEHQGMLYCWYIYWYWEWYIAVPEQVIVNISKYHDSKTIDCSGTIAVFVVITIERVTVAVEWRERTSKIPKKSNFYFR